MSSSEKARLFHPQLAPSQYTDRLSVQENYRKYCASIFPDMFYKAGRDAPFSLRGRVILLWYRGNYQNKQEVINCTNLKEQEVNYLLYDLQDNSGYWNPSCRGLKFMFWVILILGIALAVFVFFINLHLWLSILLCVLILLITFLLLYCLNQSYKNYLVSREYAIRNRVDKANRRINSHAGVETRVGTFGAWLEFVYDPEFAPIQAVDRRSVSRSAMASPVHSRIKSVF